MHNIHVLCVCMCILYIQYMYSMCAREYNVCVCGDLYTGDFEVICGSCSCFFFFSQFIQHLLTLFSICTTHTHISHHFRSLTHIHYYIHSHHIKLYTYTYVHVCIYVRNSTHTHSHICTYYLSLYVLAVPSVAPQIPTHTKHTHTLTIWFQYGRTGEWNYLVSGCQFFKFRFLSSCLC